MILKHGLGLLWAASLFAVVATGGGSTAPEATAPVVSLPGPVSALPPGGPSAPLPPGVSASWWEEVQRGILAEEGTQVTAPSPVGPSSLSPTPEWTASGDEDRCYFGFQLAPAGDVNGDGFGDLIVGAPGHDGGGTNLGRAYVFFGSATGPQTAPAWTATGDEANDQFGAAVSAAGDVNGDGYGDVAVGAYRHDAAAGSDCGRVYLFHGSAAGPSSTADWTRSGGEATAYFGSAVAAAGDTDGDGYSDLLVGAYLHDGGGTDRGQAYVYKGSPAGLALSPAWTGSGDVNSCAFGRAVAGAGDVNGDGFSDIAVGAPTHPGGGTVKGRVYVYLGSSGGITLGASINGGEAGANFGVSLSTAGDVDGDGYADLLVGAPLANAGVPDGDRGKAFVFRGSAAGTSTTASWTGSGDEDLAQYGFAVGSAGDVNGDGYADLVVGCPYHDAGGTDRGRAYLYEGSPAGPATSASWTASGSEDGANLGYSVFTAGDAGGDGYSDLLVGAPNHDAASGALANRGRVYLFRGAASLPSTSAGWSVEGGQADARLGASVSSAGDVNGDGYSDVVVGLPSYTNGEAEEGRALLFYGSPAGLDTTPGWSRESDQAGAHLGQSVSTAGDVNGDGYADVVVGAPGYDVSTSADQGRVELYLGAPSGLSASWARYYTGSNASSEFGACVASAGDANADGFSDFLVGEPGFSSLGHYGQFLLFRGSEQIEYIETVSGPRGTQSWARFGACVASAGDVNGDGYSDVLVGAPLHDGGQAGEGRVSLHLGYAYGVHDTPDWSADGDTAGAQFGASLASGDVNGDGYSDIFVGAPSYDQGYADQGLVRLFLGTPTLPASAPAWSVQGGGASVQLGASLASGDVNADGYSDLLVGAPGAGGTGGAFLFVGSSAGPGASSAWSVSEGGSSGAAVASGLDVNGDGFCDLLVGAPEWTGSQSAEGAAFLYFGNGRACVARRLRQLREDLSAPVSPYGRASAGVFHPAALGRSPFGRGRVTLEWQSAALGTPFDTALASMAQSASWSDSGLAGAALEGTETLPGADGPFCWRARVCYGAATTPLQRHGPWMTPAVNGLRETDLRKSHICVPPDQPLLILSGTADVNCKPTFSIVDPNAPEQVTGFAAYRSQDPSLPIESWALRGTDNQDGDPGTPDTLEWTDDYYGRCPDLWFYLFTAYNTYCPAEGPQ